MRSFVTCAHPCLYYPKGIKKHCCNITFLIYVIRNVTAIEVGSVAQDFM